MRKPIIALLLLLTMPFAFARDPETLDQLKQRAEAAKPVNQPKLFLEVAERQRLTATKAYQTGNTEEARAAIEEVALYGEKAGAAARASRKHLKETEIQVRDMARRLEQLRESLTYDDRATVQAAVRRLDKVRQDLLNSMFGANL
jgi:hypothetical protein